MTPELVQALSQFGPAGIVLAAVLLGGWKLGQRFLDRMEKTFDKFESALDGIKAELQAHELRDVERHNKVIDEVKTASGHQVDAVQELAAHVAEGNAEARGRRAAEEEAAERPTRPVRVGGGG